jgi:hypothetical protein
MSQQIVPVGKYLGWTLPRLEARLATLQAEVENAGTLLAGATIGGQNFQFGQSREGGSLEEQLAELQAALHYLAPSKYWAPPGNSSAVRLV